ncbi:MAG: hypothetical protein AB7P07_10065 [Hyphomonadaceae bacterium]
MTRRALRREAESLVSALVVFVVIWASAIEAPRMAQPDWPALSLERAAAALAFVPRLVAAQAACEADHVCLRI